MDAMLLVHVDDAKLHPFDDVLIELREVGRIHSARLRQPFTRTYSTCRIVGECRCREERQSKKTGLRIVADGHKPAKRRHNLFSKHRERRQCGEQDGNRRLRTLAPAIATTSNIPTGVNTTARVHQQSERQDVGKRLKNNLRADFRVAQPCHGRKHNGDGEITECRTLEQQWVNVPQYLRGQR